MTTNTYPLHYRARSVLYQLDPDQQVRVKEKLEELAGMKPPHWPGARDFSTPNSYPDYLVPVDDSIRLVIQTKKGRTPEVIAIFLQETLDAMAELAAKTAK